MTHLRPSDLIAATVAPAAGFTLGELNTLAGLVATLTGLAYLLWKWRHEARRASKTQYIRRSR